MQTAFRTRKPFADATVSSCRGSTRCPQGMPDAGSGVCSTSMGEHNHMNGLWLVRSQGPGGLAGSRAGGQHVIDEQHRFAGHSVAADRLKAMLDVVAAGAG